MDNRQRLVSLPKKTRRAMQEAMLREQRLQMERYNAFYEENKDAIDRRYEEAKRLEEECWGSKANQK